MVRSRHDGTRSAGGVGGSHWHERGSTLVEATFVAPIFFLLIFGIIEVGGAYKDKLTLSNAVTSGARTGSAAADDGLADYNILQAVKKAVVAAPRSSIQYIVVFNQVVPTACRMRPARRAPPSTASATCTRPRRSTRTSRTSVASLRTTSTSTTARRPARSR